ncbi:MAG: hypothetical protein NTW17_02150 [Candidatus Pacearchaeota archaeon]|nr:hypothetical protein [Candidatus Pacearchaeota archaeon]
MSVGTWFRVILGIIGLFLIALPFLPFDLLPANKILGFLSNNALSVIIGALLVILTFWLWRIAVRRRMMLYGPLYK